MDRVRLIVFGQVQGVFFRHHAREFAQSFGLTGWCRNAPDGTVEIMAEGSKENLSRLIEWCREGSPGATVVNVEVSWEKATGEFSGFEIERS